MGFEGCSSVDREVLESAEETIFEAGVAEEKSGVPKSCFFDSETSCSGRTVFCAVSVVDSVLVNEKTGLVTVSAFCSGLDSLLEKGFLKGLVDCASEVLAVGWVPG